MTTLPADNELDSVPDQAAAKAIFERFRDCIAEQPGGSPESALTIAAGVVTPTRATHTIDTEGGAPADDLDTIDQANHPEGRQLWLRCANAARVPTIRHNQGAGGKVLLSDGANFVLNSTKKILVLKRVGNTWEEVDRFYGDKLEEMRAWLQLEPDTVSTAADRNITQADRGKVITLTGATPRTFTFTATPAQLGDGWSTYVRNASTADLTINPASGLIAGVASYVLKSGETIELRSDATNMDMIGGKLLWRERLTSNRTYHVANTGNDANSGFAGSPWLTLGKAAIHLRDNIDFNGWAVTVQIADGTYTAGALVRPMVGQRSETDLVFQGNAANNAAVLVSVTGGNCFEARAGGRFTVKDLKVQTITSGTGCRSLFPGSMLICRNLNFGACAFQHVDASYQGYLALNVGDPYTISGGALRHMQATHTGMVDASTGATITLTGTPAFSEEFAGADLGGIIVAAGNTYSGLATGKRYELTTNGVINTQGGGPNYLPGNAAGTVGSGGQYV